MICKNGVFKTKKFRLEWFFDCYYTDDGRVAKHGLYSRISIPQREEKGE